jgi:Flp pilus assembly protein TadD
VGGRVATLCVCLALAGITWIVFGQTLGFQFVNFDDDKYVYENPAISEGLTLKSALWAFSHVHAYNWHPLTTLSHMLDCQCYGLQPGGHHFTNVLLQTAAAVLLFFMLRDLTGAFWQAAFVAAVLAIHPLRAESVAWISERKDVLSGVFFSLTLWAYVRYARSAHRTFQHYALVVGFFALGLLCKPTLVTLPLVLLLIDYWPLRRCALGHGGTRQSGNYRALLLEKAPLLAMSAASCVATICAEKGAGETFALFDRLGNAAAAYVIYLRQTIYPVRLAAFYPHPAGTLSLLEVLLAIVVLAMISALFFLWRRKRPYLLIGWAWYLGMLVPMIGIIQVGSQSHADRYTYLPHIGLSIAGTWSIAEVSASWPRRRELLTLAATITLALLIYCGRIQTSHWHDSEALWTHALSVTTNNEIAHNNLGKALMEKGEVDRAMGEFRSAIQIKSDDALALGNLGVAMALTGNAVDGLVPAKEAARRAPGNAGALNNLAFVLLRAGQPEEAVSYAREALRLRPGWAAAEDNLGSALLAQGDFVEALSHFNEALRLEPDSSAALNNVAWLLATCRDDRYRDGMKALDLADRALQMTHPANPTTLDTLAAALAENQRFPEAAQRATEARELALARKETELARRITERLELYKQHLPYRN